MQLERHGRKTVPDTVFVGMCLAMVMAGNLFAAAPAPVTAPRPATRPRPAGTDAPSARAMMVEKLAQVETEIAGRMAKRSTTPAAGLPRLELEIDARLVTRWALQTAMGGKADTDVQPAAWLRSLMLADATAAIEAAMDRQGATPLSTTQADALKQIHALTFALPDAPAVKDLDAVANKLAVTVVMIVGTQNVDIKSPPLMRPKPREAPPATRDAAKREGRTLAELAADAQKLTVSAPLKQQVLELAKAASAAKDKEATACQAALEKSMELCEALQANAVSAETRARIETQLTEGVALFGDPRTRAAGDMRIDGLQQYRRAVARFNRLELADAQRAQLAPLFAWAQDNPEPGGKALAAVEKFVQCRGRFEKRAKPAAPLATLKKPGDDLEKQFDTASLGFMAAAIDVPKPTAPVGPADLEAKAEEMRRVVDLLEKFDQMPKTLEVINAYKPKPFGALERRVATSATAVASLVNSAGKADAAKFLDDLAQLAALAAELSQLKANDVSPEVERLYAGGQWAAVETKWKTIVGELSNQAAGGVEIDKVKLARLPAVKQLLAILREAETIESSLAGAAPLSRWIDWRMSPEELRSMVAPYAALTSATFAAHLADAPTPMAEWMKGSKQYRPFIVELQHASAYRDACATLPTGLTGLVAGLLTPMDNAPFATERFMSLAAGVRAYCVAAGDEAAAAEVVSAIGKRLARDLHLE